jgi:hypothetical protein
VVHYDWKIQCLLSHQQTYSTMTIFILAMVLNPEKQKLAQQEIDEYLQSTRLPEISDRGNLPYVDALVKETMRWHPVNPIGALNYRDESFAEVYNNAHFKLFRAGRQRTMFTTDISFARGRLSCLIFGLSHLSRMTSIQQTSSFPNVSSIKSMRYKIRRLTSLVMESGASLYTGV